MPIPAGAVAEAAGGGRNGPVTANGYPSGFVLASASFAADGQSVVTSPFATPPPVTDLASPQHVALSITSERESSGKDGPHSKRTNSSERAPSLGAKGNSGKFAKDSQLPTTGSLPNHSIASVASLASLAKTNTNLPEVDIMVREAGTGLHATAAQPTRRLTTGWLLIFQAIVCTRRALSLPLLTAPP